MWLSVEDDTLSYFAVRVLHHVGPNKLHDKTLHRESFIYLFPLLLFLGGKTFRNKCWNNSAGFKYIIKG